MPSEGPTRGHFRIITDNLVRDPGLEQRILESNIERNFYLMLLVGSVLVFLSMVW